MCGGSGVQVRPVPGFRGKPCQVAAGRLRGGGTRHHTPANNDNSKKNNLPVVWVVKRCGGVVKRCGGGG